MQCCRCAGWKALFDVVSGTPLSGWTVIRSTMMTQRTERRKGIRSNQKDIIGKRRGQGISIQLIRTLSCSENHWTNLRWFPLLGGRGEDFLLTNQLQRNLTTASSNSRSEQKNKDNHYSHYSWRERGESERSSITVMYSINHCVSVKTILCAKTKKLFSEKSLLALYFICFIGQRWLHNW